MKIFDGIIRKTTGILSREKAKTYEYSPEYAWPEGRKNELVMGRESAYELGAGGLGSVSLSVITTSPELVARDEILLYGKDLRELKEDSPFARIAILLTDYLKIEGEQASYEIIKELELVKYGVYPKGYMIRASAMTNREQVRVARCALMDGINFESLGNLYISKYKENSHVKAVKIIFVTVKDADYSALDSVADSANNIAQTINHVFDDINVDCGHCSWRPICEEVDGMREMHFKHGKR